jgi:hypothetical protein
MSKRIDYRSWAFTIVGLLLTWAGVAGFVTRPAFGNAAMISTMCLLVGVDALVVALWRTRYRGHFRHSNTASRQSRMNF